MNNINSLNFIFIAKVEPAIPSNLPLKLNISIPLSCISIMALFVGFLCYRSFRELSEIKIDSVDGKPFKIIQAAMILPIDKTPDLLNNNKGKNLWKGAIERLKQEQSQNNPLNDPSTFLKRASSSDKLNNNNNNNDSNNKQNQQDGSTLADIVNSLIKNRRETLTNGMLGAQNFKNHVPSISVRSPSVDLEMTDEQRENTGKSDSNNLNSESSFSQGYNSEIKENHTRPVIYKSKAEVQLINKQKNGKNTATNKNLRQAKDPSPIFKNKYAHVNDKHGIQSKRITFFKDGSSCFDSSENESESSSGLEENTLRNESCKQKAKRNRVEIVVEINRNSFVQQEKDVFKEHTHRDSTQNEYNLIQPKSPISLSPPSPKKQFNRLTNDNNNNSDDCWDNDGCVPESACSDDSETTTTPIRDDGRAAFERNTFRESIRQESERRKEQYFPSTSSSSERNFDNIALPPLIQQNQYTADYNKVTLV